MKRIEAVELSADEIAAIISGKVPPVSIQFNEILHNFPDAKLSFEVIPSKCMNISNRYIITASAEEEILKP